MQPRQKTDLYQRIVAAKLLIDGQYATDLDLNQLASKACFSKFHFLRLFKGLYGKTPKNYLLSVRLKEAKTLLAAGSSVLETCLIVGFQSPTSFAGAFRKCVGTSPSNYQRAARNTQIAGKANPLQFVPNCFAQTQGWTNAQL